MKRRTRINRYTQLVEELQLRHFSNSESPRRRLQRTIYTVPAGGLFAVVSCIMLLETFNRGCGMYFNRHAAIVRHSFDVQISTHNASPPVCTNHVQPPPYSGDTSWHRRKECVGRGREYTAGPHIQISTHNVSQLLATTYIYNSHFSSLFDHFWPQPAYTISTFHHFLVTFGHNLHISLALFIIFVITFAHTLHIPLALFITFCAFPLSR